MDPDTTAAASQRACVSPMASATGRGNPVRGQHEAEVALRPGQVEHAEREGDRRDRGAEHRDELPGEEQPELTLRERPEPGQTRMQAAA